MCVKKQFILFGLDAWLPINSTWGAVWIQFIISIYNGLLIEHKLDLFRLLYRWFHWSVFSV